MLYIDKYRPKTFEDVKFNHKVAGQLKACSHADNIPHIIINGPRGSGRKTFSELYVQEKYHKNDLRMKQQKTEIKYANKTVEIQLLYSPYHYLIDLSIYGVYDRLIIQGFIKDLVQTPPISGINYRIIILENADRLTQEAQHSLRRTLEKYINNCQYIFNSS